MARRTPRANPYPPPGRRENQCWSTPSRAAGRICSRYKAAPRKAGCTKETKTEPGGRSYPRPGLHAGHDGRQLLPRRSGLRELHLVRAFQEADDVFLEKRLDLDVSVALPGPIQFLRRHFQGRQSEAVLQI